MNRGKFISLEGIDGSGKSTHLEYVGECIREYQQDLVITRDPGGTEVGEAIRNILLNSSKLNWVSELLLLFASREELADKVIIPNLYQGKWVLSDRFIDSSAAYQGAGRGLGMYYIKHLHKVLCCQLYPDLTLVFNAPINVITSRLEEKKNLDRIEQEPAHFLSKVQSAYAELAIDSPERFRYISTNCSMEDTREQIKTVIGHFMKDNAIEKRSSR